jgi:SHS2 domain-containing protein
MPYQYLKDMAVADVAFFATGKTLSEMFESAGLAVTNTMIKDLKKIKQKSRKKIEIEADTLEHLLFNFLQEFIFWKDKSQMLFSKVKVKVSEPSRKNKRYSLSAALSGEKMAKAHEKSLVVDVKAVTWHMFELKKKGDVWFCQVILDV